MNNWINVKDRLPIQLPENIPTMNWVLVTSIFEPNPITIARYDGNKWEFIDTNEDWTYAAMCGDCTYALDIKEITHWTPMPNPPMEINKHEMVTD